MRLTFRLLNGELIHHSIKENDVVTIGRSPKCTIVIAEDGMSRQHCQLEVVAGEVFITDLGSTNGVFIDGQRIPPNTRTPYLTYLTLAFGAVQTLQFDAEDTSMPDNSVLSARPAAAANAPKADPPEATAAHLTKTKATAPGKAPPEGKPRARGRSDEDKKKFWLLNAVILLAFAGLVYWYVNSDLSGETPDFEAIPDLPETSDPNN
jgi:predicted component of type VI protein secretion system